MLMRTLSPNFDDWWLTLCICHTLASQFSAPIEYFAFPNIVGKSRRWSLHSGCCSSALIPWNYMFTSFVNLITLHFSYWLEVESLYFSRVFSVWLEWNQIRFDLIALKWMNKFALGNTRKLELCSCYYPKRNPSGFVLKVESHQCARGQMGWHKFLPTVAWFPHLAVGVNNIHLSVRGE